MTNSCFPSILVPQGQLLFQLLKEICIHKMFECRDGQRDAPLMGGFASLIASLISSGSGRHLSQWFVETCHACVFFFSFLPNISEDWKWIIVWKPSWSSLFYLFIFLKYPFSSQYSEVSLFRNRLIRFSELNTSFLKICI